MTIFGLNRLIGSSSLPFSFSRLLSSSNEACAATKIWHSRLVTAEHIKESNNSNRKGHANKAIHKKSTTHRKSICQTTLWQIGQHPYSRRIRTVTFIHFSHCRFQDHHDSHILVRFIIARRNFSHKFRNLVAQIGHLDSVRPQTSLIPNG
mmetsp:Transcript_7334/g.15955  ORF Transcript_7334/g.15955 Transcript_7334/m.15955 type:complete len:150 (-) Transcript_7334:533-982(-)